MRQFLFALVLLVVLAVPAAAQEANGWITLSDQSGLGFEAHNLIGNVGVFLWGMKEERESPGAAVSETPIKANQTLAGAVYELTFGPVTLGAGVGSTGYSESGKKTQLVGGVPTLVGVQIVKEDKVVPIGTARVAMTEGALFADAQGIVSTEGLAWMARVGWKVATFWAGVGYASGPGEDGVSAPLVFVGASF